MSIAILNQVYDETRRLAIAGSNLAKDDFRLRKLVPPLEKAGEKAPVFGQVARLVTQLIDGAEKESPQALLDLSSLVTAVLYTQGTTDIDGKINPIETTEVSAQTTQTSARLLKPLIDALTTTGSGRLNTIKESFELGAFDDLRLVNYAIAALDDKYKEIGDFVAENILPKYGRAICPQVQQKIEIKGTSGSCRRLKLLHNLAPELARPLVLEAFEDGNKEMKIAALSCLGDSDEDLPLLQEQATSRNKEVRGVALSRMSKFSDAKTIEIFSNAIDSKDLPLVAKPISQTESRALVDLVIFKAAESIKGLADLKVQKKVAAEIDRLYGLLECLEGRTEKKVVKLIGDLFDNFDEQIPTGKSLSSSRESLLILLSRAMLASADSRLLKLLVAAKSDLPIEGFSCSLMAARYMCKPTQVYQDFSEFYLLKGTKKPTKIDKSRQEMVAGHLADDYLSRRYWVRYSPAEKKMYAKIDDTGWDSKWLDAAIQMKDFNSIRGLVKSKNEKVHSFIEAEYKKHLRSKDIYYALAPILQLAIRSEHPDAANMIVGALKHYAKKKNNYHIYWLYQLIGELPKKSLKIIETGVSELPEKFVDPILPYLQTLKNKT